MKDSARLEIQEQGIKICDLPSAVDERFLKIVGKDANGWYTQEILPLPQMEMELMEVLTPGMKAFLEAAKSYRGWQSTDVCCMYANGWIASMVIIEGLRLAIEKVGFENLTGPALREGIISITNLDTGLGCPPLAVSNDRPWWCTSSRLTQIQNGKHHPVSEWIELEWVQSWTKVE